MVGRSGSAWERSAVVTASARSLPALMYSIDDGAAMNSVCTWPPTISASAGAPPRWRAKRAASAATLLMCARRTLALNRARRRAAAIRHMHHLDPSHELEQLARHMIGGTSAARRHVDAVRVGLG